MMRARVLQASMRSSWICPIAISLQFLECNHGPILHHVDASELSSTEKFDASIPLPITSDDASSSTPDAAAIMPPCNEDTIVQQKVLHRTENRGCAIDVVDSEKDEPSSQNPDSLASIFPIPRNGLVRHPKPFEADVIATLLATRVTFNAAEYRLSDGGVKAEPWGSARILLVHAGSHEASASMGCVSEVSSTKLDGTITLRETDKTVVAIDLQGTISYGEGSSTDGHGNCTSAEPTAQCNGTTSRSFHRNCQGMAILPTP